MSINSRRVLLLVDADMVAFSCAAAVEYGKEPEEIKFVDIQNAIDGKMKYMINRLNPTDVISCVSGTTNMRHVICPTYKENRKDVWRPENLANAKAHTMVAHNGVHMDGLEADDLMAMFSRHDYELEMGKRNQIKAMHHRGPCKYDEVIIASLDKDLKQIVKQENGPVIKHFRWETQHSGEKLFAAEGFGELNCIIKQSGKTTKKEIKGFGPKFFLWQMLTGDTTDGIMGCGVREKTIYKSGAKAGQEREIRCGVGAVEAFELLNKVTSYAEGLKVVSTQYLLRFADSWQKEMLTNGRLLYMAHHVEDGHKVRMWHYKNVVEHFDLKSKQLIPAV